MNVTAHLSNECEGDKCGEGEPGVCRVLRMSQRTCVAREGEGQGDKEVCAADVTAHMCGKRGRGAKGKTCVL
eukprot:365204-Chlamydomonas_euryale.AAC.4